jgi:hypothetical protein
MAEDTTGAGASVLILETADSAPMEFAARALKAAGVAFTVVEDRPAEGTVKRHRRLLVESDHAEAAMKVVMEMLQRRIRMGQLPRQTVDSLKTRSQGGIWPDEVKLLSWGVI